MTYNTGNNNTGTNIGTYNEKKCQVSAIHNFRIKTK